MRASSPPAPSPAIAAIVPNTRGCQGARTGWEPDAQGRERHTWAHTWHLRVLVHTQAGPERPRPEPRPPSPTALPGPPAGLTLQPRLLVAASSKPSTKSPGVSRVRVRPSVLPLSAEQFCRFLLPRRTRSSREAGRVPTPLPALHLRSI